MTWLQFVLMLSPAVVLLIGLLLAKYILQRAEKKEDKILYSAYLRGYSMSVQREHGRELYLLLLPCIKERASGGFQSYLYHNMSHSIGTLQVAGEWLEKDGFDFVILNDGAILKICW